jgi:hypothetical protein
MTEPWEWEEADLLALIENKAEEGLELDFKRCDALDPSQRERTRNKLSKHVSALANSIGGAIVYGIVEERHAASCLDAGYDPESVTREWIEQLVSSNVRPRVNGFRVKTIELTNERPGKVAYVVWVPQSSTAHQASDNRYYKRRGSESLPMEDYEIRDVMQRASAPSLSVVMTIDGSSEGEVGFDVGQDRIVSPRILISAQNDDDAGAAEYCQFQFFVPEDVSPINPQAFLLLSSGQVSVTPIASLLGTKTVVNLLGREIAYRYFEVHFGPGQLPFFAGESRSLVNVALRVPLRAGQKYHILPWRVRASRAEPVVGAFVLREKDLATWGYWNEPSFARLEELGAHVVLAP